MDEVITTIINAIVNTKTAFLLSTLMIVADIISGYIKAFKNHTYSSSVNRDGLARKMMWFMMLCLGVGIEFIIHTNILTVVVAVSCVITEFMSIIENCRDIGIEFKITKYLEGNKE